MTPGSHPIQVNTVVIKIAPHPQSKTANGGKITHNIALIHPICQSLNIFLIVTTTCTRPTKLEAHAFSDKSL